MSPAHLSAGERTDQARPEGDVGGKQPVQEGQRLRGGKGNRRHQRAGQAEEENERYDRLDSGDLSSRRSSGLTVTKMAMTAANESWKPGSKSERGFQTSNVRAPSSRKYQRSRGRAANQASEASDPATAALTTDGCKPTTST